MDIGITETQWETIARDYGKAWGANVYAVDPEGGLFFAGRRCPKSKEAACSESRKKAVLEALRWGEPSVELCPHRRLIWAVPLMRNERVLGGLVASIFEHDFFKDGSPGFDIQRASRDLRERVEQLNLTNASALAFHRSRYQDEQQRAYAIHAYKDRDHSGIRELYLHEEPALFAAIRAGDRAEAREILNRILVAIHHHAGDRLDLIKSLFLELVVSMSRTAVEAGADPQATLGANYVSMTALADIDSEETLAPWLASTMERMMDAIHAQRRDPGQMLFDALHFMERHCGEKLKRDDVARAVHISPSHFSYLIRKESGVTFTELLNRVRVDRSVQLLRHQDKPLALVALECGFEDQSYFTKVFKRYRNVTPHVFRRKAN